MKRPTLHEIVDELATTHGEPQPLPPRCALDWVLWETVAYLSDDDRRAMAFAALRKRTGLSPERIRAAPLPELTAIARIGGIHPQLHAKRLHEIADLVLEEFAGDLEAVLRLAPARALNALKKFPAIGRPGAEKILLMTGAQPFLALESNGLRALVRLGFGFEASSYEKTYRAVREALAPEVAACDCAFLQRAHSLLRRHGQTLCRRLRPRCEECRLQARCAWFTR